MCFIIENAHPKRLKAEKDIVCYKILTNNLCGVFSNFQYELDELYIGRMYKESNRPVINVGFHSISAFENALYLLKNFTPYNDSYIEHIIVRCIIPKDSAYYYNSELKEYVSNQIIIKERIE